MRDFYQLHSGMDTQNHALMNFISKRNDSPLNMNILKKVCFKPAQCFLFPYVRQIAK